MTPEINEVMSLDEVMQIKQYEEEYKDVNLGDSLGYQATLEYMESTNDAFNKINTYLMTEEVKYYAENNAILFEDAANQGKQSNIFKRLIERFLKWLEDVRDWFANTWKVIKQKLEDSDAGNKAFLIKFKKHLAQIDTVEFEGWNFAGFDTYNFNFYELDPNDTDIDKEFASDYVDKAKRQAIKQALMLSSNSFNLDDYSKNLKEKLEMRFYSGKKKIKATYKISEQISIISSYARQFKIIHTAFQKVDMTLKAYEANCKVQLLGQRSKEVYGKQEDGSMGMSTVYTNTKAKNYSTFMNAVKAVIDINKTTYNAYCQALIDKTYQAKKICIKAMQENPYHEAVIEEKPVMRKSSINDIYASMA